MTISDETLMGFADGELDAATRAEVEAALREDPHIAKRIDEHLALRSRLQRAYAHELTEVPPQRLVTAARGTSSLVTETNVVSLAAVRLAAERNRPEASRRALWRPAASIAASLVLGIGVGAFVFKQSNPVVLKQSGGLLAAGILAKALSSQSGNAVDSSGTVQIGLSFLAKSGDYCRTFTLTSVQAPAGLACRRGSDWRIEAWAESAHSAESAQSAAQTAAGQNYRTASSSLPPALVSAVEERIVGDPLDQAGEAAALRQDWRVAQPR